MYIYTTLIRSCINLVRKNIYPSKLFANILFEVIQKRANSIGDKFSPCRQARSQSSMFGGPHVIDRGQKRGLKKFNRSWKKNWGGTCPPPPPPRGYVPACRTPMLQSNKEDFSVPEITLACGIQYA